LSAVTHLRRIAEVLALGHRAAEVVPATDLELGRLIETSRRQTAEEIPPIPADVELPELLELVRRFDADRLTRILLADWARLDHLELLQTRIAPLIRAVGAAWEQGELEVRHEHFVSERVGDLLRSLRLPLESRSDGPLVVLGSLPGESHSLGLQMAALVLALARCRVLQLGTEVPVKQLAELTRDLGARALGLSVSVATRGSGTNTSLRRLRELLPRRVEMIVGGDGAPRPQPGLTVISDLRSLDSWARQLQPGAGAR
jgi:methanogenic corrinoid protein MtbC1